VKKISLKKNKYLAIQNANLSDCEKINISLFCSVADISRDSYYQYRKHSRNQISDNNRYIEYISEVQDETGYGVGYRRMTAKINREFDVKVNTKRVRRLMDESDKLSVVRRKRLTEEQYMRRKEQKDNIPKDLLKMNFFSGIPRKIFVEDITYVFTFEQMFYLNTIEDLFNKEIVAWCIGTSPDADLCVSTVIKLKEYLGSLKGIILHSDTGSTYTSYKYRDCLKELEIIQSCSKGSCYFNAAMESFNGIYKTEGAYNWFGKTKYLSRRIRAENVLEKTRWFLPYYNNVRLKQELGFLSPAEYLKKNPKGTLPMIMKQS
jgi:putative transposase